MNYVNHLNFFGVETKEIPCIKGTGAPTKQTVGAVGLFYMDTNTGATYKCTSEGNGSYVWEEFGGKSGPAMEEIVDAVIAALPNATEVAY